MARPRILTALLDVMIDLLREHGAEGAVLEELVAYCAHPYDLRSTPSLPLGDEPHVERWRLYAADAAEVGTLDALQRRLIQLRFPVAAGISSDPAYRNATRSGNLSAAAAFAPGLTLRDPRGLRLELCPTVAGTLPVLTTSHRDDFVALVQALTERNEPVPVPESMGACIVSGLNNWDRVAAYRERWTSERGGDATSEEWNQEFARLVPRKEQYQDRFVILSAGPYSATAPEHTGVDLAEWLRQSVIIRREHELTHYFTARVFGRLRSHVLDELLADFSGLLRARGSYDGDLARRWLGLHDFPAYRAGGRLENYKGQPPLSDEAFAVITRLAYAATRTLERVATAHHGAQDDPSRWARLTSALFSFPLPELAAANLPDRLDARLAEVAIA